VKRMIAFWVTSSGLMLSLSACTNPYDPAQRFVGGGLLGAGAGAAIGAAAGGGPGAALGAAIGGATGAIGGVGDHATPVRLLLWIPRLLRIPRLLWIPGLLWISQLLRLSRLRLLSIGSG
jgi:hypothetical protein